MSSIFSLIISEKATSEIFPLQLLDRQFNLLSSTNSPGINGYRFRQMHRVRRKKF